VQYELNLGVCVSVSTQAGRLAQSLKLNIAQPPLNHPANAQAAGVARFVQNPAYWGPKSRHGTRLSEQQERQYKAHAAAAGHGATASGSHGSNGRQPGGGSSGGGADGEAVRQLRQQMAEVGELEALYGSLNDGAAAGGNSDNNGNGGSRSGSGGVNEDEGMGEEQQQEQQPQQQEETRELEPATKRSRH